MNGPFECKPITKAFHCPNATTTAAKYAVETGDIIFFSLEDDPICAVGRVLGWAVQNGKGEPYKKETVLLVLRLSDNARHAYLRHVDVNDVREVQDHNEYKTFVKWFYSSELPPAETLVKAVEYGAIHSNYIGNYLDAEGNLREDWRAAGNKK